MLQSLMKMQFIEIARQAIRSKVHVLATVLHRASHGKIHPDSITIIGLFAHLPIAWLIATGYNALAAALLALFGLFDTLDGELARIQHRSSVKGMLLDASADRIKETAVYTGFAFALANSNNPRLASLAVAACGMSLSVSYIKAKGEAAAALATQTTSHESLNKMFKNGLLSFELRMFLLVVALLINREAIIIAVIVVLATFTALQRLLIIRNALT